MLRWKYEKRSLGLSKLLDSTVQSGSIETHVTVSVNASGYNIISKNEQV